MAPTATTIAAIANLAHPSNDAMLCFAGTPVVKPTPLGIQEILRLRNQATLTQAVGLTKIKNAMAFTAPVFQTRTSHQRNGHSVQHFATVLPTTSEDLTHPSFYPAPGLHEKPREKGQRQPEYWEITEEFSDLIRQGEQEHLDDARRAYELTYKCVENEINKLAGRRFGPASTPGEAEAMAVAELARRLPRQLGANPANWVAALDRLLSMTELRDKNLWHAVSTDSIRQDNGKVIERLKPATFFRVGLTPSRQLVHLYIVRLQAGLACEPLPASER
jgi:hypothetical protein